MTEHMLCERYKDSVTKKDAKIAKGKNSRQREEVTADRKQEYIRMVRSLKTDSSSVIQEELRYVLEDVVQTGLKKISVITEWIQPNTNEDVNATWPRLKRYEDESQPLPDTYVVQEVSYFHEVEGNVGCKVPHKKGGKPGSEEE